MDYEKKNTSINSILKEEQKLTNSFNEKIPARRTNCTIVCEVAVLEHLNEF